MNDFSSFNQGSIQLHQISAHAAAGIARLGIEPGSLAAGSCHVWILSLTVGDDLLAALWPLLTEDERTRADAFRVPWARNQFVQVRGVLRLLLGEYLGRPATDIGFDYGEFGKPALVHEAGWHFNVAHSGDYALLAVANGYEVGVDIEKFRASAELASLARMVLSRSEAALWQTLPDVDRASAFFAAWTGKEAVAKAVGQGLRLEFPRLDIGLMHQGRHVDARAVTMDRFGTCRLVTLPAPPGYAAALAVRETA
ncbi:4'-phosphopantetheinyl transferase family protein [Paralcaligenes ureilyticus]|uniref:4'-phosphopantetheinyl transferase n=1 Tax=Paralcaligenes ureilyticus TaxID=627131 RepID=A0A4R3LQM0_9BURK|nr:4'-phosphopantetheinyl transferase superfamily protein [Paralcaligenes ureilyticus]TCT02551.1 4'-phosphopantetheinyl transferase [Paralcaligenes ureilyticus]